MKVGRGDECCNKTYDCIQQLKLVYKDDRNSMVSIPSA